MTAMSTDTLVAAPVRPGLAWQRRLRRKLVILDAIAGLSGSLSAVFARYDGGAAALLGVDYRLLAGLTGLLWVVVVAVSGGYDRRIIGLGTEEFRRIGNAMVRLLALLVLVGFAFKADSSRTVVAGAVVAMGVLTLSLRSVARWSLHQERRAGRCMHRVVAVGAGADIQSLITSLGRAPYAGLRVVAACLTDADSVDLDVPVLGTGGDVVRVVDEVGADMVAVASVGERRGDALRRLAWSLEGKDVDLLVAPALTDVAGPRLTVRPIEAVPLLEIDEPSFDGPKRVLKAVFDAVLAGVGFAVLLLPMLAIGLAVRLTSPGPALFRQTRVGRDGRTFQLWKFRTMVAGADAMTMSDNDVDGLLFKLRRDPRVTPVGRSLRRWSLDELPQLWNVLRGDMSLVGPRPPVPEEVAQYGDDVRRRLLVKPGLTGLWQVSGRSDLPWEECVRLDLRYVENWSVTLDLLILVRTVVAVARGRGAY
jgi:exopolysaccharide biosynthesis polyprenyl glycosylphosphotransferase